jgi:hypothetical protein
MKNLVIILALLSLTACEKKYCWKCADTIHKSDSLVSTEYVTVCDQTEKEIRAMESSKGYSRTVADVEFSRTCSK